MTGFSAYDEPPEGPGGPPEDDPRDPDAPRDAVPPTGLQALRDYAADYWDLPHTREDGSLADGIRKCPHCWGPAFTDNPTCPICHFTI